MLKVIIIISIIILIIVLFLVFLHSIKICGGGMLKKGCGRLLFPWTPYNTFTDENGKKKYCCIECLTKDLELLKERTKDPNSNEMLNKLKFTSKEELKDMDFSEEDNPIKSESNE